ncbi:hypothetical protein ACHAPU_010495 [Fusarium lateritium]
MQTESSTHSGVAPLTEKSPFTDVTFNSVEDAAAAHAAYIQGQFDNCDTVIRQYQREIEATTKRQREILEKTRVDREAREKASFDVSDAENALKRANALCEAEDAVSNQDHHLSVYDDCVMSLDHLNDVEKTDSSLSNAQIQRRSAVDELAAKQKCLTDISERLQLDHAQAAPLLGKIYDLLESKESEEKNQRTLTILSRLIRMGPKLVEFLEEVLGDSDIDEWTEEKLRQVEEAVVL